MSVCFHLQVERVEVQDLRPKATSDTATAMKKQMISERQRRSEFIQAEGNKAAMKLRSEGLKIVKTNLVSGQRRAAILMLVLPFSLPSSRDLLPPTTTLAMAMQRCLFTSCRPFYLCRLRGGHHDAACRSVLSSYPHLHSSNDRASTA